MSNIAPDLEELYGPDVVAALDRPRPAPEVRAGRSAAAALTAALLTGVAASLDERRPEPEIAEFEPDRDHDWLQPVTVHLVPGVPAASVALVRPWLIGRRGLS